MTRYSGKKTLQQEIVSRHFGEMRSLLHALELNAAHEDSENRLLMDMYESEGEYVLEFDLPGFRQEDISLTVEGMTLVLEAQRPREPAESDARFLRLERGHGRYRHVAHVPGGINAEQIRAEYRRGVLRVICPKVRVRIVPVKEIND